MRSEDAKCHEKGEKKQNSDEDGKDGLDGLMAVFASFEYGTLAEVASGELVNAKNDGNTDDNASDNNYGVGCHGLIIACFGRDFGNFWENVVNFTSECCDFYNILAKMVDFDGKILTFAMRCDIMEV